MADCHDHIGHDAGIQFQHYGIISIVRQFRLGKIHLLFQVVISIIHICSIVIFEHDDGHIFLGLGRNGIQTAKGTGPVLYGFCNQLIDIIRAGSGIDSHNNHHGHVHIRH